MEPGHSRDRTRINSKNYVPKKPSARSVQTLSEDWSITTPGPIVDDRVTRFK